MPTPLCDDTTITHLRIRDVHYAYIHCSGVPPITRRVVAVVHVQYVWGSWYTGYELSTRNIRNRKMKNGHNHAHLPICTMVAGEVGTILSVILYCDLMQ